MRTGEGSSSPSSAWVSQQVFPVHPNWRHLLHWEGFCICLSPLIFTLSTAETTPIGLLPCWLSKLWKPPLPSSKLPKYRTSICQKKWYIIYDKKTTGDHCKLRKKSKQKKPMFTMDVLHHIVSLHEFSNHVPCAQILPCTNLSLQYFGRKLCFDSTLPYG